jgi:hypothetical protein
MSSVSLPMNESVVTIHGPYNPRVSLDKMHMLLLLLRKFHQAIRADIHKKGDIMVCSNYGGIGLLCIAYEIFCNILFNRLSPCVEGIIGDHQCGFRQGRSTNDQIFTICPVLKTCNEFQIETTHLFIDFRSAYDAI